MDILKYRDFAIKHHKNQLYDDKPYVYHLDKVYHLSVNYNMSDIIKIATYLHDIIEDTAVTKEEIVSIANEEIYNLVFSVSGFGANRKERKQDIINKIDGNIEAINLKMLDRIANIEYSMANNQKLYLMYCEEHKDYERLFKLGNQELFNYLNVLVPNKANKLKI